jgi:hypothetical protein
MRSELAGPDPSPVEALLAARVSLAWLHAHVADLARAVTDSTSTRHLRYLDDRAASSERRLLAACKALATVRRLGVPSILARLTAPCTS